MKVGGSGGVVIVQKAVIDTLTDPTVHGQLPHTTRLQVDPILAKDPAKWDEHDCTALTNAIRWALCNLT